MYEGIGNGGNSTVIVGNTSVIVVDAKTSEAGGKALLAEIAKVTPKPVTTVFITHSDGDHVNGIAGFPANVKVIAHENNKKEQEAAIAAGGRGAPPPDRLPSQVITKDGEMMTIDGVRVMLHWGPAHTSGDLIVHRIKGRCHGRRRRYQSRRRQPELHRKERSHRELIAVKVVPASTPTS